jgi:hypothetical protein
MKSTDKQFKHRCQQPPISTASQTSVPSCFSSEGTNVQRTRKCFWQHQLRLPAITQNCNATSQLLFVVEVAGNAHHTVIWDREITKIAIQQLSSANEAQHHLSACGDQAVNHMIIINKGINLLNKIPERGGYNADFGVVGTLAHSGRKHDFLSAVSALLNNTVAT